MNKREIIEQTIRDQLGVSQKRAIDEEDNLFDDYGADSLDSVELMMAFEEVFEMEIPDEEAEKWQTVGDIMKYFGVDQ